MFHLGENVKVITGDQLDIGKGTVRRLSMGSNMYSSSSVGWSDRQGGWIRRVVPKYEIMRWLDTSTTCRRWREQHVALTKMDIDITVDDEMNMALSVLNII